VTPKVAASEFAAGTAAWNGDSRVRKVTDATCTPVTGTSWTLRASSICRAGRGLEPRSCINPTAEMLSPVTTCSLTLYHIAWPRPSCSQYRRLRSAYDFRAWRTCRCRGERGHVAVRRFRSVTGRVEEQRKDCLQRRGPEVIAVALR
jgi:hypothetical protein